MPTRIGMDSLRWILALPMSAVQSAQPLGLLRLLKPTGSSKELGVARARLSHAQLRHAQLRHAQLRHAQLRRAQLRHARRTWRIVRST
ncbi:pentapeptide repeat-containing protein [Collinsella ureilytica]|uniref:pentapeptide repeat-containing protein n=1 Tax=Collinsella ureilytica TaxID=2869515 RepID=UPI00352C9945